MQKSPTSVHGSKSQMPAGCGYSMIQHQPLAALQVWVLGRPERQDQLPSHGADHGGGNHGTAPDARQPIVSSCPENHAPSPNLLKSPMTRQMVSAPLNFAAAADWCISDPGAVMKYMKGRRSACPIGRRLALYGRQDLGQCSM